VAIRIGTNIDALSAERQLNSTSLQLSSTFQRLSSGQRINNASDDAAGLAVASDLTADSRVYGQALHNINDGISYLSVADGAVEQLKGITTRIKELSEQSANGVYSTPQRTAMNTEVSSLSNEYNRIVDATSFNGIQVFSSGPLVLQMGYGGQELLQVAIGTATVTSATTAVGDGTFQSGISTGGVAGWGANGDFNADGVQDMIAVSGTSAYSYLSNGNGSFRASVSYILASSADYVISGDFNGDGKLDFISAETSPPTSQIEVFLGNGNGTFQSPASFSVSKPFFIRAADVNGDGKLDLIDGAQGSDAVYLGNGNGSFSALAWSATETFSGGIAIGDFNGDSKLDLATGDISNALVRVYVGNGNGTFSATGVTLFLPSAPKSIQTADLNGDAINDLVTNTGALALVFIGNGNGTFAASTSYTYNGFAVLSLADVNSDGKLDLLSPRPNSLSVALGNGDGSFGAYKTYAYASSGATVSLADENGDGIVDAIIPSGGISVLFGNGSSSSSTPGASAISHLSGLDITTTSNALSTLSTMSSTLDSLNSVSGIIGSSMSRLQTSLSTLTVRDQNYQAAAARITDADVAQESANLTRLEILQQAGQAVLAQANQQPRLALQLLRG
jgi:flagellin